MRLTVFGATGAVGQEIVGQALDAGHEVTAVVRDPDRLPEGPAWADLHAVVRLGDEEAVRAAVAGRDAVLSGLGPRARKDAGIAARLTRVVLAAMEAEQVRRVLAVSAGPVGPAPVNEGAVDRWMRGLVSAVLKDVYADLSEMEAELAASGTDWTVVRPPRLQDKPVTGVYRVVTGGFPARGRFISRADVAHAMLGMIGDAGVVKQGVGVAY